jgi:N-acetylmuramoyl-L-alanine amidase
MGYNSIITNSAYYIWQILQLKRNSFLKAGGIILMANIMIDPGHGDWDPGAIGPTGVQEKIINLAVAKMVAKILMPVAEVKLTRDSDIALGENISADLTARANLANAWPADCFVSIHCNSVTISTATGTETYCYPDSTKGSKLANAVHNYLAPALGIPDRGVKTANFAVLRQTDMPACLVELAFISNPAEEALLVNSNFQLKAARAIAEGIAGYLGLQLPAAVDSNTVLILVGGQVLEGQLINDRTWAPVRALAEALGRTVEWDEKNKTVTIQ